MMLRAGQLVVLVQRLEQTRGSTLLPERNRLLEATPVNPPYSASAPRPMTCTSWIQL